MSFLGNEYVIPVAIGFLWSIQTCCIGYILVFYLLHECYIASRIKIFGVQTTGVITGRSHEQNEESSGDDFFIHYKFQLNPPYPNPTWNDKIKIAEAYYEKCQKGEMVRIIFDPVTRNSDFYYDGYRKNICSRCDAFCFCLIIPFPLASIATAVFFAFAYDILSGLSCLVFGLLVSVPVCIYLCRRRNTFCYRFKWRDSEDDIGVSKHQSIQDIKHTFERNRSIHGADTNTTTTTTTTTTAEAQTIKTPDVDMDRRPSMDILSSGAMFNHVKHLIVGSRPPQNHAARVHVTTASLSPALTVPPGGTPSRHVVKESSGELYAHSMMPSQVSNIVSPSNVNGHDHDANNDMEDDDLLQRTEQVNLVTRHAHAHAHEEQQQLQQQHYPYPYPYPAWPLPQHQTQMQAHVASQDTVVIRISSDALGQPYYGGVTTPQTMPVQLHHGSSGGGGGALQNDVSDTDSLMQDAQNNTHVHALSYGHGNSNNSHLRYLQSDLPYNSMAPAAGVHVQAHVHDREETGTSISAVSHTQSVGANVMRMHKSKHTVQRTTAAAVAGASGARRKKKKSTKKKKKQANAEQIYANDDNIYADTYSSSNVAKTKHRPRVRTTTTALEYDAYDEMANLKQQSDQTTRVHTHVSDHQVMQQGNGGYHYQLPSMAMSAERHARKRDKKRSKTVEKVDAHAMTAAYNHVHGRATISTPNHNPFAGKYNPNTLAPSSKQNKRSKARSKSKSKSRSRSPSPNQSPQPQQKSIADYSDLNQRFATHYHDDGHGMHMDDDDGMKLKMKAKMKTKMKTKPKATHARGQMSQPQNPMATEHEISAMVISPNFRQQRYDGHMMSPYIVDADGAESFSAEKDLYDRQRKQQSGKLKVVVHQNIEHEKESQHENTSDVVMKTASV